MDKPTYDEMYEALKEWIVKTNSLSADSRRFGLSDSVKWGEELSKRCEPLRGFCEKYRMWED